VVGGWAESSQRITHGGDSATTTYPRTNLARWIWDASMVRSPTLSIRVNSIGSLLLATKTVGIFLVAICVGVRIEAVYVYGYII
jgi:hypothetical protein